MPPSPHRAESFSYDGYTIDPTRGEVHCTYSTGGYSFTERYLFSPEGYWDEPAVEAAVRILYLMAGVSYYKTGAAHVVDLGPTATTAEERAFLMQYYLHGLGEFAYRNGLELDDVSIVGLEKTEPAPPDYAPGPPRPLIPFGGVIAPGPPRPLIPFGGGIDSIVAVNGLREGAVDPALCIVHPPDDRFAAIEEAAAVTGLPVVRIGREIDRQLRHPERFGFFNGHVPITAIITAASLVAAVLARRDAVVLSNEWSASAPTLVHRGHPINHQWSKSLAFEEGFAHMVDASLGPQMSVFSYLRSRSELWVAQQFARLKEFHDAFRSCNRAFHQNPAERHGKWCGTCDKCCFIDLILSPFMEAADLRHIFGGLEPLDNAQLEVRFLTLVGLAPELRPFECVGDVGECRAAVHLAGTRPDRQGTTLLQSLLAAIDAASSPDFPGRPSCSRLSESITYPIAMHPLTSWSALASASVGLWGLGIEGRASLRRLESMGLVPVLVDDNPAEAALGDLEVLATDRSGLRALLACDVVIKSPGISRHRPEVAQLEQAGVPVRSGLGLWLEDVPLERVTCITGTKGKSTTSAIAGHLLNGLGYEAKVGGNIGQPPWEPSTAAPPDYWVIETSSYQVPDLTNGPPVVAVTSLSPDHLDWHGSVELYYAEKLALCTKAGVRTALVDDSNVTLHQHAGALGSGVQWIDARDPRFGGPWLRALGLPGVHNARNAAMARAVLGAMGIAEAGDAIRMAEAAEGFHALPSRCQSIGHVGLVEFVDDSLSTNVLPAQAALEAYGDRPVALLVGGHDRGLDYTPLGQAVARRTRPTFVVTMPSNGPRIGSAIREVVGDAVEVTDAAGLEEAVATAWGWARSGGVVLLSPAAPSFGRYTDYRERAQAFATAAARCGPLT